MTPKKYYIVTNLITNEEVLVNTLEDLINITGCPKGILAGMKPAELIVIDDWQIICDETKPIETWYYKNLWR